MRDDVERDWAWADKFLPHQTELVHEALRVDIAPIHDDMRRNTDLILRSVVPLRLGRELRISARVRRHGYLARVNAPGLAYREQVTIRDRRPSGAQTEMDKLRLGEGDIFIYGFESEPGSDKLFPWVILNLDMVREYDDRGGYSTVSRNKGPYGSWLRVFNLDDLPLGAVIKSAGVMPCEDRAGWLSCRNSNWDDPARPVRSGWCNRRYAIAVDEFLRKCLFCGFKWHADNRN